MLTCGENVGVEAGTAWRKHGGWQMIGCDQYVELGRITPVRPPRSPLRFKLGINVWHLAEPCHYTPLFPLDPMNFPGLALRCYCDALSTTAEQVTSLIPSVALRNVFFLVLQVLYIASPRCAGLLDGRSPSEIWEPRDGRLAFEVSPTPHQLAPYFAPIHAARGFP